MLEGMNGADSKGLRDRGASTLEYAGIIVLAAVLFGALTPLLTDRPAKATAAALCRILGQRNCEQIYGTGGPDDTSGQNGTEPERPLTRSDYQQVLCTELDLNCPDWDTERGVSCNDSRIQAGYGYYQKVWDEHPEVTWAGLAKLAGTTVYAAMQDIHILRTMTKDKRLDFFNDLGLPDQVAEKLANIPNEALDYFEDQLAAMQKAIFMDLGWELEAYSQGGVKEMRRLAKAGQITPQELDAWEDIGSGDPERVKEGNQVLAYREQHDILQPFYDDMKSKPFGDEITYLFGFMIDSPVPGGKSFGDWARKVSVGGVPIPVPVPMGNIATFDTRWKWITGEMVRRYNEMLENEPQEIKNVIDTPLAEQAKKFRILPDVFMPYNPKDGKC